MFCFTYRTPSVKICQCDTTLCFVVFVGLLTSGTVHLVASNDRGFYEGVLVYESSLPAVR